MNKEYDGNFDFLEEEDVKQVLQHIDSMNAELKKKSKNNSVYLVKKHKNSQEASKKNAESRRKRRNVKSLEYYILNSWGYDRDEAELQIRSRSNMRGILAWYNIYTRTGIIYRRKNDCIRTTLIRRGGCSRKEGVKLRAGDIVSFMLNEDTDGSFIATSVKKVGHVRVSSEQIELADGIYIKPTNVLRYGTGNAISYMAKKEGISERQLLEKGYEYNDFKYIFIYVPNAHYRIYRANSPVQEGLQVDDLDKFMNMLDRKIYNFHADKIYLIDDQQRIDRKKEDEEKEKKDRDLAAAMINRIRAEIIRLGYSMKDANKATSEFDIKSAFIRKEMYIDDDPKMYAKLFTMFMEKPENEMLEEERNRQICELYVISYLRQDGLTRDIIDSLLPKYDGKWTEKNAKSIANYLFRTYKNTNS